MIRKFKVFLKKTWNEEFSFIISMPALFWQFFFLILPIVLLFIFTFTSPTTFFTLENYTHSLNKLYCTAIYNSLKLAYLTAFCSLIFCIPLSLVINFYFPKSMHTPIIFFLMMPSWTNFIIRIYSWFFLLKNEGFIFQVLRYFQVISEHSSLFANFSTTLLVMVYCYFPFMLVPINSAISNIDKRILESSDDLGASKLQTFFHIILPLCKRSISFGFAIIVLSAFGEFVIPEFVGGGFNIYWGNLITSKFLFLADYRKGGAILFCGLGSLLISIVIFYLISKIFVQIINICLEKISQKIK